MIGYFLIGIIYTILTLKYYRKAFIRYVLVEDYKVVTFSLIFALIIIYPFFVVYSIYSYIYDVITIGSDGE